MTTPPLTTGADGELTVADREEIARAQYELGYILDAVDYDRFVEIYAPDLEFVNPDGLNAHGVDDLIAQSRTISRPAVSHQVTNVVIAPAGPGRAQVRSRGLTVRADRSLALSETTDQMERRPEGWRIVRRRVRLVGGAALSQYV